MGMVDVCTEMEVKVVGGLDACCLCLGGLAFGNHCSLHGASTMISTSLSELSCLCSSEASPSLTTHCRFLCGLIDVCRWCFPFLQGACVMSQVFVRVWFSILH